MSTIQTEYTLLLDYGTEYHRIYCDNAVLLRAIGQDHHKAAKIKPCMTITNSASETVAEMDEWATEWKEGRGA